MSMEPETVFVVTYIPFLSRTRAVCPVVFRERSKAEEKAREIDGEVEECELE